MTTATVATWPVTVLVPVVTVLSLLVALLAGVIAALNRRLPTWMLAPVLLLELAVIALAAQCLIAWAQGNSPAQPIVFVAYLLVVLAAPVATWWWGSGEPSRWGAGVVCVAALVLPVLLVRLEQVWSLSA